MGAKGRCFVHASEEGKRSECPSGLTPQYDQTQELQKTLCHTAKRKRERWWKKNIGEPDKGEPYVRFDEGEQGNGFGQNGVAR